MGGANAAVGVSASFELLFASKLVTSDAKDVVERHFRCRAFHVGSAIVRCGRGDVCRVWCFP